jgi:hypothetical protein
VSPTARLCRAAFQVRCITANNIAVDKPKTMIPATASSFVALFALELAF